ncbi:hypothetical protein J2W22_000621 [Sphingomonas kyeonggiensis]|uniref:hypothetical protein n=1 Tax=Sphingomonas kyeonggiensis TaxID=1268553 RepID=UPI002781A3A8|nr:hypothetical protein [Sphingomonas kyeonggiensis]MDQ0248574.1 hypothetical protein [Sphingomonas kyeonggiensis]
MTGQLAHLIAGLALFMTLPAQAQSIDELRRDQAEAAQAAKRLDRADAVLLREVAKLPPLHGNDFSTESVATLLSGWRGYIQRECALVGAMTGAHGPSSGSFAAICETRRYTERVRLVQAASACLTRETAGEEGNPSACLKPLVVLKGAGDFDA